MQWYWRFVQGFAPDGYHWEVHGGSPGLFDSAGFPVGSVRYAGDSVRVVLDDEFDGRRASFHPLQWVAESLQCDLETAAQIVRQDWEHARFLLRNETKQPVHDAGRWKYRLPTTVPHMFGPLYKVSFFYGPGADAAIRQVSASAPAHGFRVVVLPEISEAAIAQHEVLAHLGDDPSQQKFLIVLNSFGVWDYYSARNFYAFRERWFQKWVSAGHVLLFRGLERHRPRSAPPTVSSDDLRGAPEVFASTVLVYFPDPRGFDFVDEPAVAQKPASWPILETTAAAPVSAVEVPPVPVEPPVPAVADGTTTETSPVPAVAESAGPPAPAVETPVPAVVEDTAGPSEIETPPAPATERVEFRPPVSVAAMAVVRRVIPSANTKPKQKTGSPIAENSAAVPPPPPPPPPPTPPPPAPEPEVVEDEFEVCIWHRTTAQILERVWGILDRRGVVALDSGTLWVLSASGDWVDAGTDPKHLRWRLYRDIQWTTVDHGQRVPHFALLELADLMALSPDTRLGPRPAARAGRVVKIHQLAPLAGPIVALDLETSGPGSDGALDPRRNTIELVQVNDGTRTQLATTRGCTREEIADGFRRIFEHAQVVIGHNLLFDLTTIWAKTGLLPRAVFDTMVAAALLRIASEKTYGGGAAKGLGLAQVAHDLLGVEIPKTLQNSNWAGEWTAEQLEYAARDVQYLHAIAEKQVAALNQLDSQAPENILGLRNRVALLEMDMVLVMVEPSVRGIPVNLQEVERQIAEAHARELAAEAEFLRNYPEVKNINSLQQVQAALRAEGIRLPDMTAETLGKFSWYPGVRLLLDYKAAAQVYRNLKRYREAVLHPSWHVVGSGSGRMSSSNPNVQNVPKSLKPRFYSREFTVIKADYPAIESRLAAAYAGEKNLIDAFNAGEDIHIVTASRVLGKPPEAVTKSERQLAKALNYGLLYGVGAARFAASANADYGLQLTAEEASEFREKFFQAYPSLREWHWKTAQALRSGRGMKTRTLLGRVAAHNEEDFTDALNYPIQGSGADLLKLAAVKLWRSLQTFAGRARILNLVHDEIVVAVTDAAIAQLVAEMVREAMESAAQALMPGLKTPVDVDIIPAEENLLTIGVSENRNGFNEMQDGAPT